MIEGGLKVTLKNYNTLFIIFLIITVILFILLVTLFFVFDIRKIVRVKTGLSIKQSVKEINEINQEEGNRQRKKYRSHSIQLFKNQSDNLLEQSSSLRVSNKKANLRNSTELSPDTTVTVQLKQKDNETMVLQTNTNIKPNLSQNISNSGDNLKGEFFDIFETKIVMFSNEIITKPGGSSKI